MIIKTDYQTILQIWEQYLWVERTSKIETHSAMLLDGTYDMKNFNYVPSYFIYLRNGEIAGCNSGHMCLDNTYRSRGLYVFPQHRGNGIGLALLLETIKQAKIEKSKLVWSYPRKKSWRTYKKAGFKLTTQWSAGELDLNAYCVKKLS